MRVGPKARRRRFKATFLIVLGLLATSVHSMQHVLHLFDISGCLRCVNPSEEGRFAGFNKEASDACFRFIRDKTQEAKEIDPETTVYAGCGGRRQEYALDLLNARNNPRGLYLGDDGHFSKWRVLARAQKIPFNDWNVLLSDSSAPYKSEDGSIRGDMWNVRIPRSSSYPYVIKDSSLKNRKDARYMNGKINDDLRWMLLSDHISKAANVLGNNTIIYFYDDSLVILRHIKKMLESCTSFRNKFPYITVHLVHMGCVWEDFDGHKAGQTVKGPTMFASHVPTKKRCRAPIASPAPVSNDKKRQQSPIPRRKTAPPSQQQTAASTSTCTAKARAAVPPPRNPNQSIPKSMEPRSNGGAKCPRSARRPRSKSPPNPNTTTRAKPSHVNGTSATGTCWTPPRPRKSRSGMGKKDRVTANTAYRSNTKDVATKAEQEQSTSSAQKQPKSTSKSSSSRRRSKKASPRRTRTVTVFREGGRVKANDDSYSWSGGKNYRKGQTGTIEKVKKRNGVVTKVEVRWDKRDKSDSRTKDWINNWCTHWSNPEKLELI